MMNFEENLIPPARLALAYAPQSVRAAFGVLLRLDMRFAAIVGNAREPLIGQMKLAWWRDAIRADAGNRPLGEPLLSVLSDLPVLNSFALNLADAWETLIVEEKWSELMIQSFATARGRAVFGAYAALAGLPDFPEQLAEQWAMDDLQQHFGQRVEAMPHKHVVLPKIRALRPLTILAASVREISGPRLIWHALTGR